MHKYFKPILTTYFSSSIVGGIIYGVPKSKELTQDVFFKKENLNHGEKFVEYIGLYLVYGSVISITTLGIIPYYGYKTIYNKK